MAFRWTSYFTKRVYFHPQRHRQHGRCPASLSGPLFTAVWRVFLYSARFLRRGGWSTGGRRGRRHKLSTQLLCRIHRPAGSEPYDISGERRRPRSPYGACAARGRHGDRSGASATGGAADAATGGSGGGEIGRPPPSIKAVTRRNFRTK